MQSINLEAYKHEKTGKELKQNQYMWDKAGHRGGGRTYNGRKAVRQLWDVDGDEVWAVGVGKDEDGTVGVHEDVIGASNWAFLCLIVLKYF